MGWTPWYINHLESGVHGLAALVSPEDLPEMTDSCCKNFVWAGPIIWEVQTQDEVWDSLLDNNNLGGSDSGRSLILTIRQQPMRSA